LLVEVPTNYAKGHLTDKQFYNALGGKKTNMSTRHSTRSSPFASTDGHARPENAKGNTSSPQSLIST